MVWLMLSMSCMDEPGISDLVFFSSDMSTPRQIKTAFRKAALQLHPDRSKVSHDASADGFAEVQGAFDLIMKHRSARQHTHGIAAQVRQK